jgi:vanillate O-demethylase monooxygenase subunit
MRSEYASAFLYLRVQANYQIVIDNLLDLNHAPFLHAGTLAPRGDGPPPMPRHEFRQDGEVIHSNYSMSAVPPSPQMHTLFTDPLGEFAAEMTWRAPANLDLDVWQRPIGGGGAAPLHMPSQHYLTPETQTVTHYFAAVGRNLKILDADEDARMSSTLTRAFVEEDEPMLRACQSLMGTTDLFSLDPCILKSDIAAIQARRILDKLITAEMPPGRDAPVAS